MFGHFFSLSDDGGEHSLDDFFLIRDAFNSTVIKMMICFNCALLVALDCLLRFALRAEFWKMAKNGSEAGF